MDFSKELSRFEVGSVEHNFFEKIFKMLGSNFVRKSVEEEMREAQCNLSSATQDYFQSYIYASAITEAAKQLQTSKEDDVSSFYLNSVQKYLLPNELPQQLKLHRLSQEDVLKAVKNKNSKNEIVALKKLTEENIKDFCIKLNQHVGGIFFPNRNWQNTFDRTIQDLKQKATLLSSDETKEWSRKQLKDTIKIYYEELTKHVLLLNKMLSLESEKLEFESDVAHFYLLRCHTISLKAKCFEQKMLEMTYNEETIPALKKIRAQLDQTEHKLQQDQNEKTVTLEQYLKLGEEYEHIVDEYTRLTKAIREQQWSLEELKKRMAHDDASGHNSCTG